MEIDFTDIYYPTMSIRPVEMLALRELPDTTKNSILPIFLLSPWTTANDFQRVADKIIESYGNRPCIVDLDRGYKSSAERPAVDYFKTLIDPENEYSEWVQYISENENFIPVVQIKSSSLQNVRTQIDSFLEIGRPYIYRFNLRENILDLDVLLNSIEQHNVDDVPVCIVDGGWTDNPTISELSIRRVIDKILESNGSCKFIVSGASFPDGFSFVEGVAPSRILSREIFSRIRRQYNQAEIFYGDWSSTRPRRDGRGSKALDRIDISTRDRWISARSKKNKWDFVQAAKAITQLPEWAELPNVWGKIFIQKTADGLSDRIYTGPKANASRVNMHLYTQANYAETVNFGQTDEPWIDTV